MCVSINGPGDLDLWPFDRKTGVRVASKMGNLPSKFGNARPFGLELLVMYATDERTDKRRDGRTKATLIVPFATGGAIINLLK